MPQTRSNLRPKRLKRRGRCQACLPTLYGSLVRVAAGSTHGRKHCRLCDIAVRQPSTRRRGMPGWRRGPHSKRTDVSIVEVVWRSRLCGESSARVEGLSRAWRRSARSPNDRSVRSYFPDRLSRTETRQEDEALGRPVLPNAGGQPIW